MRTWIQSTVFCRGSRLTWDALLKVEKATLAATEVPCTNDSANPTRNLHDDHIYALNDVSIVEELNARVLRAFSKDITFVYHASAFF